MANKQHWLYKKYDVDGWFHKHLLFKNDWEFIILLVWALFVTTLLLSIE